MDATSIVNRLVMRLGGREGWVGWMYTETTSEQATRRLGELRRSRMRIELEQEDLVRDMRRHERRTQKLWKDGRQTEARQAVRELRAARTNFTRTGQQRAHIDAVCAMMQELVNGDSVEQHVEFYALAMSERLQVANPQRMALVLQRCSTLDEMRRMTANQLKEHFDDAEQDEMDRVSEERDEEQLTEDILVELGCLARVEDAVTPPTTMPGAPGGAAPRDDATK